MLSYNAPLIYLGRGGAVGRKGVVHGLINYIGTKAKYRHLKKLPVLGLCGSC
jgi:hypothetical protein